MISQPPENLLLGGICDINDRDMCGNTPLIVCCKYAHAHPYGHKQCLRIVKLLLKHRRCGVNLGNKIGWSALMYACLYALPEFVACLLSDSRCDPCRQDRNGNTALIICCYKENSSLSNRVNKMRVVKMILNHENSGIVICNGMDLSALHYACSNALPEIVELMLSHSECDPCQQALGGLTPLYSYLLQGRTKSIQFRKICAYRSIIATT